MAQPTAEEALAIAQALNTVTAADPKVVAAIQKRLATTARLPADFNAEEFDADEGDDFEMAAPRTDLAAQTAAAPVTSTDFLDNLQPVVSAEDMDIAPTVGLDADTMRRVQRMNPTKLKEYIQNARSALTPEQLKQLTDAYYDKAIEKSIRRARTARVGEVVSDVIGRSASRFRGREPGATKKEQRLAQDAAQRKKAEEDLAKDPLAAQKERGALLQEFLSDVSAKAGSALGASDDPAIAAAQERVKLANKMLDYMKTGNTGKSERENAKKVAGSFLVSVSRGTDSTAALNKALQSMKTLEGLDMLAEEINLQRRNMRAVSPAEAKKARAAAKASGNPSETGAFTAADITAVDKAMDPGGIVAKNRAVRAQDPNFPKSIEGFTPEQMRILKEGDYNLALREAKQALTDLESFPGMEEMMLTIARQSAPEATSVAEAFDIVTGMTAEQAQAQDALVQSDQERAMDYISSTGRHDLLTSDKSMRRLMDNTGLTKKELPFYIKNIYKQRRERAALPGSTEVPNTPYLKAKAAEAVEEEERALQSVRGLVASRPSPLRAETPGGTAKTAFMNSAEVDQKDEDIV